jgi:hypothetical protein
MFKNFEAPDSQLHTKMVLEAFDCEAERWREANPEGSNDEAVIAGEAFAKSMVDATDKADLQKYGLHLLLRKIEGWVEDPEDPEEPSDDLLETGIGLLEMGIRMTETEEPNLEHWTPETLSKPLKLWLENLEDKKERRYFAANFPNYLGQIGGWATEDPEEPDDDDLESGIRTLMDGISRSPRLPGWTPETLSKPLKLWLKKLVSEKERRAAKRNQTL